MPIRPKGARLYLRAAKGKERSAWVIRDGSRSVRTGCAPAERAAAEQRLAGYGSTAVAKRELEGLRAAVNYHRKEGLCDGIVEVIVPEKAPPSDRWVTKAEAARLIRAAWRYREVQKGSATDRRSRRHVAAAFSLHFIPDRVLRQSVVRRLPPQLAVATSILIAGSS